MKVSVLLIFVISIAYLLFSFGRKEKTEKPAVPNFVYKSISPGTTPEEEVVQKLGNPKEREETAEGIFLKYSSASSTRNDIVLIKEGRVYLIKEVFTYQNPKNIGEYKVFLGEPPLVLYGKEASAGNFLFSYPDKGLSFVASDESGLIYEVWYFAPTTEEVFRNTVAPDYKENPDELQ